MRKNSSSVDSTAEAVTVHRTVEPMVMDGFAPVYSADGRIDPEMSRLTVAEGTIVRQAAEILARRLFRLPTVMSSPAAVREYARTWLGARDREAFAVLFLDGQNGLIAAEVMFIGTGSQTSVYPREIARRALVLNAAAVVLLHQHPSQTPDPSAADRTLTQVVKGALRLLDINTLDHLVVTGNEVYSFAEHGLI